VIEAGGAAGRTLAADARLRPTLEASGAQVADGPVHTDACLITATPAASIEAFAAVVRDSLRLRLEEGALDEMSDQSFPASDPPAITPSSVGHVSPDRGSEGRA